MAFWDFNFTPTQLGGVLSSPLTADLDLGGHNINDVSNITGPQYSLSGSNGSIGLDNNAIISDGSGHLTAVSFIGSGVGLTNIPNSATGCYSLFSHFADVSNVTTGNTILYTDALTAGLLAANGNTVEAEYSGTFATSANTKRVRLYFGPAGTASDNLIFDSGALGVSANGMWDLWVKVIRESSSIVRVEATCTFGGTGVTVFAQPTYTRITGLTLSAAQSLTLTGTSATTGASVDVIASMAKAIFLP